MGQKLTKNQKRFWRREFVSRIEPKSCPECPKFKRCLKPCEEIERWINQDNTGYHAGIVKANAEQMGSSNEFVDLMQFYKAPAIVLDSESADDAYQAIKKYNLQPVTIEVIRLYYRDGKRICQCAVELGITSQAVHGRLIQAKKELKKKINRREIWKVIKGLDFKSRPEYLSSYCYFKRGYTLRKTGNILSINPATIQYHIQNVKSRFSLT
jgi:DNA-directed RNA polymerase specialized sigma subunit